MGILDIFRPKPRPTAPTPKPHIYSMSEVFKISGFNLTLEELEDYLQTGSDFDFEDDDLKGLYNTGQKIYEYEARPSAISVTLGDMDTEKFPVFFNGQSVGYIGKPKSLDLARIFETATVKRVDPIIEAGAYKKIVKNEAYNPDYDDPEDRKEVEWFDAEKPVAKIEIYYEKEG